MRSKRKLFLTTAFAALLGVGAFAGVSLSKESVKPVETEAISSGNVYVRCTRPSGWGDTLYCHYFGGSSESKWPGVGNVATYNNSYGQTVFIFEVPENSTIIFNNNSWQTNNISLNNTGNCWYLGTNIWQDRSDFGTWTPSTYTIKVYDSMNYLSGNVYAYSFRGQNCNSGHIKMNLEANDYLSNYFYTLNVDEMYSNFIVTSGSWDAQTADLTPDSSKYYVLTGKNGSSISGNFYDNTDYVYAMDWVNHEMHMADIPTTNTSDTGACRGSSGYYQKAKNAYQTYTGIAGQVQYVAGYEDAFARFSDWATANGETATFNGTTLTVKAAFVPLSSIVAGSSGSMIAIISISAVSLAAIGGYFLFRKKKEN